MYYEMVTASGVVASLYVFQVCCFENLALGRPTWQQYPWPDKAREFGSKNAVDGLYTNRSEVGGQCAISDDGKYTAIWRVYLEKEVSISHIDIYYRTDNAARPTTYTSRMAGFYLYVSNSTSAGDGHLCFHEMQTLNGTPSEVQRINCSAHGQYVIYYNERQPDVQYPIFYSKYAYIELCEVEVYGCREYGYFGNSCMNLCPINCLGKRCDINSGHCLGCFRGYQGPHCSQVCENQTYGLGCSSICGKCRNGETCHHVNGSCLHGCSEGVQGDRCQEECQNGYYGKDCNNRCSVNCNVTSRCDKITGQCNGGCNIGWTGNACKQKVSTITGSENSDVICTLSIVISAIIVFAGSVLNVFCWKRHAANCNKNRQSDPTLIKQRNENRNENIKTTVQHYMEIENTDQQRTTDGAISYTNLNLQL